MLHFLAALNSVFVHICGHPPPECVANLLPSVQPMRIVIVFRSAVDGRCALQYEVY